MELEFNPAVGGLKACSIFIARPMLHLYVLHFLFGLHQFDKNLYWFVWLLMFFMR